MGTELGALRDSSQELRSEVTALALAAEKLHDELASSAVRLNPGPFREDMTVHAAHARHPATRRVFAARGLPHCPSCAVGADETLAEAASAEGLDLQELLAALRALES